MPKPKPAPRPRDPIIGAYETFVRMNEKLPFDLFRHGVAPYPGHMILFLAALAQVDELAEPAGGLTSYGVYDYVRGSMNVAFRVEDPDSLVVEAIYSYLHRIGRVSRKGCVICGEDARVSTRFMPHEWKMPVCNSRDYPHTDEMLYRLIEPDFDLTDIRNNLIRRRRLHYYSATSR